MRKLPLLILFLGLFCCSVGAQHDLQRNAARLLARGRIGRAIKRLEKKADEPESLFLLVVAHCRQGEPQKALEYARKAVQEGLPFSRLQAGPRSALAPLYELEEFQAWSEREGAALLHGAMVGSVTDGSARFWFRTSEEADVRVELRPMADRESDPMVSDPVASRAGGDYTGVIGVRGLRPKTRYLYTILVNGKAAAGASFRTYPKTGEPARFTVGFGGGAGYVPRRERMWRVIDGHRPLAFLMLGDNVYIDDPEHPLTQRYCYYRRQSRPEWRRFTARSSMYAIYDDHDFGTNDCVPGPDVEEPAWKRDVWEVFRQNWNNPSYGGGEKQPGCWHDFHIGDVHFIMLDCRYYRDLKGGSMLGQVQKRWLMRTLKKSRGTFKVIASSVPFSPGVKPGSRDTWDGFPQEREDIFRFLTDNDIEGVVLISADRHRSDIRKIKREEGYDLVEFESSRLTNNHTHRVVKTPGLIFGYNKKCSFGLLHFDTTQDDPTVTFEIRNIDDEAIHSYPLPLSQLKTD